MSKILLTGGTGFVGGHVARSLCAHGFAVRALVRATSSTTSLSGVDVELCRGDLRDLNSLRCAMKGCRGVFHVAADYRLWARDPSQLYENNVTGTENLLRAAAEVGVDRFVYTSTVGVLRFSTEGTIATESDVAQIESLAGHYKRSKFLAESLVLRYANNGFPAVVVSPSAPVGECDIKPTQTGKIVLDFMRGRMPAYVDTGLNLVDVRDVAEGHLLAWHKGVVGERYILGGKDMSLREILEALAATVGRPAPKLRIPLPLAVAAGYLANGVAALTGRPPRIPLEGVKMARYKMYVSSEKAHRDLGYRPSPPEPALERAVAWFRDHGYEKK
jgi:dihydroflavonol-4-reductase